MNAGDEGQKKVTTSSSLLSKDVDVVDKRLNKLGSGKYRSRTSFDFGADGDGDQHGQGLAYSREEKVSTLKTGLIHVARKMPKNAHANFLLGLMYQRLGQPQKAVLAYEKATEILLRCEEEIGRPEFLSLVQIHHAQCILLETLADSGLETELELEELEGILLKLKESIQTDIRQTAVWNSLGLILLKTGRVQNAIFLLSSLLVIAPDNLDCLGNLGIAYLQSIYLGFLDNSCLKGQIMGQESRKKVWHVGNLELAEKCFQDLILKDQNHPAALMNYATLLLCKHGSTLAGAGANADEGSSSRVIAANVAKDCLLTAIKEDPKAAHLWANLGNAYFMAGDHRSSGKCLEKAVKLDSSCMSTRFSVAIHRIKVAERSQDPTEQIPWAGNEMASILREGDSGHIEPPIGWTGLALAHKVHHEIKSTYEIDENDLKEVEDRAITCLKQAVAEDPDDAVQWHQLGLHSLSTQQFKTSQKYFKAAISRLNQCSYAWTNLGTSIQLSEEFSEALQVYSRALSLVTLQQAHTIFSNLGILFRQQKQYEQAKAMLSKALELKPGYAPAYNNLGLVFVAEAQWEEAKFCFEKALLSDPLLDAAQSNLIKAAANISL